MEYGLNISDFARQIAEQAIPQGKGGHYARYDKDAARVLSAAISITLREVVIRHRNRGAMGRPVDAKV